MATTNNNMETLIATISNFASREKSLVEEMEAFWAPIVKERKIAAIAEWNRLQETGAGKSEIDAAWLTFEKIDCAWGEITREQHSSFFSTGVAYYRQAPTIQELVESRLCAAQAVSNQSMGYIAARMIGSIAHEVRYGIYRNHNELGADDSNELTAKLEAFLTEAESMAAKLEMANPMTEQEDAIMPLEEYLVRSCDDGMVI